MPASPGACRARSTQRGRQPRSNDRQASSPRAAMPRHQRQGRGHRGQRQPAAFPIGVAAGGDLRCRGPVGGGRHQPLRGADDRRGIPRGPGQLRRPAGVEHLPGGDGPGVGVEKSLRYDGGGLPDRVDLIRGQHEPAVPRRARTGRPGPPDRSCRRVRPPGWGRTGPGRHPAGQPRDRSPRGQARPGARLQSTAAAAGTAPHSCSAVRRSPSMPAGLCGQPAADQRGHAGRGIQPGIEERGQRWPGLGGKPAEQRSRRWAGAPAAHQVVSQMDAAARVGPAGRGDAGRSPSPARNRQSASSSASPPAGMPGASQA